MKRRKFLANSAVLGTAIPLGVATPAVLSSCTENTEKGSGKIYSAEELGMYSFVDIAPDGKPLKAALIGCGDRGTGAAVNFLHSGPDLQIIALADVLTDRMEGCRHVLSENNNTIDDSNCFIGFDAYRKVMAIPEVDLVLLCTPTHFRPVQFKAAVEAGKHVFMEKPCAVDPSGIRTVIAAAKVASGKGLTVITGNQRRHRRDYWEAYVQVRNGIIGEIISTTSHWNQGAWWNKRHRPEWSDMEYCLRNWFNIKWLSGDHILDQGIHNIDVVTWFMGEQPVRAVGFGGSARRLTGDIFDFFSVDYYYNNHKRMLHTARQIDGCDGNVSEQILGTKGIAQLNDHGQIKILDWDGNILWEYDYQNKPVKNPYEQEHIHLVESIRLNKKINQAEDLAYSTQIAIMGREAAYTGQAITWDEIMASNLRYGPETYEMGPLPDYHERVVPVPGKDPSSPM
ncbi:Gfo/Idh/MocA family oxidoreductase [Proteiniphilum sp.]|uniref:Gfo/Idh/MocA family protein n=1 Tax=Proteiniphilum sp. TaxID=1926877 RepID=UPI002B203C45|nr:Gfo/Idh/MocA family oxidoreductase [Proteiniphilum sp.]MEA4917365.1 Gfo/Idh/MocA family oxidoreductase [Proteiniphilum sp.]